MKFQRMTYICMIGFGIVTALWTMQFARVRSSDIQAYKQIIEHKTVARTAQSAPLTTHQTRQKVRKEIWFTQEDQSRLHYRIESASSLLTLLSQGDKFDVVEKLEKMKCWMQDKIALEPRTQQLRYFETDEGIYSFKSQHFYAQRASMSLYRLSGLDLPAQLDPTAAFLAGTANDVSFSISDKSPRFQAKQFKASLRDNRSQP